MATDHLQCWIALTNFNSNGPTPAVWIGLISGPQLICNLFDVLSISFCTFPTVDQRTVLYVLVDSSVPDCVGSGYGLQSVKRQDSCDL